jgi:hypothetical protein
MIFKALGYSFAADKACNAQRSKQWIYCCLKLVDNGHRHPVNRGIVRTIVIKKYMMVTLHGKIPRNSPKLETQANQT